ncbi:TIGR03943 family protein [Hoyosella sp. YIM 151337]|uniref:TIGR03943 family putative permease subunit n=1 Tax=Hoyosella sp. YIM 151337 TaxID=2992742 RepID=UPI002236A5F4|nr:TIGR03943 family protein [Hoyosella sp. YIM 151337]MCW4355380.1 TIGR03943 family protein [Hoyosella sp. YIM 151337]
MIRATQNAVLLLLGCVLVKIVVDGAHMRYVRADFGPFLLASGLLITVLALLGMLRDFSSLRVGGTGASGERSGRSAWLLCAPLVILLFVHPPPLGPETLELRPASPAPGGFAQAVSPRDGPKMRFDPLPDDPYPEVGILEVIRRSAFDSTGSLEDREISIVGFVMSLPETPSERVLARVSIVCCAADARLVSLRLSGISGTPLADAADRTWFELRGTAVPGSARPDNGYTPLFRVTSARAIAAPPNTYEHP